MKTENENWKEFLEDELNEMHMLCIRGGDGPEENPSGPIIK